MCKVSKEDAETKDRIIQILARSMALIACKGRLSDSRIEEHTEHYIKIARNMANGKPYIRTL
jgi:hypothetical protein